MHSAVVAYQSSGNFIRAVSAAVPRVSGDVETFTTGSWSESEIQVRCGNWSYSWHRRGHRAQHHGFYRSYLPPDFWKEEGSVGRISHASPRKTGSGYCHYEHALWINCYHFCQWFSLLLWVFLLQWQLSTSASSVFCNNHVSPTGHWVVFTSLSIMIETRYQNMPIIAVWRKAWKRHILVAVINSVLVTIWASTYLFIAIKETLTDHKHHNCDMPFTKLWATRDGGSLVINNQGVNPYTQTPRTQNQIIIPAMRSAKLSFVL